MIFGLAIGMPSYSFIAYIDESGSEGSPDKDGASEFLIISAVIVRETAAQSVTDLWDRARRCAKKDPTWDWKSFKDNKSPHNKFLISRLISDLPIRIAAVFAHKPTLYAMGAQGKYGELYFYLSHLLLERISWICRDEFERYPYGDGTPKIVFSERSNLRMDRFADYVKQVKSGGYSYTSDADLDFVNFSTIYTRVHKNCDGLRIADFVASAFGAAVEYKQYDLTDDRYIMQMRKKIYVANRTMYRNGIKFFPPECEADLLAQPRMRWIGLQ